MASTIRARIQLDGAQEVSTQLQKLQGVFTDTGKAIDAVGSSFANIIGNVEKAVAAFAILQTAAIATTAAFTKLGKNAVEAIDKIGDSADAVGLTTKEYQKLSGAAEAAGVAANSIDRVFRKLSVDIEQGAKGTGKIAEKYKEFGIQLTDGFGKAKSFSQVLGEIANVYARLDVAKRPEFLKALGFKQRDAAEFAQLLSLGAKGIEDFAKKAERLKYVPTDKDNEIVARSIAAASLLKDAWQKFSIEVGKAFIPLTTSVDTGLLNLIDKITVPLSHLTQYIASKAKPVIEDFFNMVGGGGRFNNMQFAVWQVQFEALLARFGQYYSLYIEPFISGFINGVTQGFNLAVTIIQTAINAISAILTPIGVALQPVRDALSTLITPEAIGQLTGFAATVMIVLIPALNAISPVISLVISSIGLLTAALGPGGLLFAAISGLAFLFVMNWDKIKAKTEEIFANLPSIIQSGIDSAASFVSSGLDAIAGYFTSKFDSIKSTLIGWFDWLSSAVNSALDSVSSLASKAASVFSGGGGGYASGGYISGPGTGTSDSIPAWLSNGEFVVRAAAVRRFGVDFFRKLNGMSLDPSAMLGRYGFASGGFVGSLPAMASSASSSSRTFNLVIDGRNFGNLTGQAGTIDALEKFASIRQLSATAKRSPSRIG